MQQRTVFNSHGWPPHCREFTLPSAKWQWRHQIPHRFRLRDTASSLCKIASDGAQHARLKLTPPVLCGSIQLKASIQPQSGACLNGRKRQFSDQRPIALANLGHAQKNAARAPESGRCLLYYTWSQHGRRSAGSTHGVCLPAAPDAIR